MATLTELTSARELLTHLVDVHDNHYGDKSEKEEKLRRINNQIQLALDEVNGAFLEKRNIIYWSTTVLHHLLIQMTTWMRRFKQKWHI